jgi:TonB-linked SusC/RagA family outer membrane protein
MQFKAACKPVIFRRTLTKTLLIMKITALLLIVCFVHANANTFAQTVTLKLENASIQKAFREIEKQTGYSFVYAKEQLADIKNVNIKVKDASLDETLNVLFKDKSLSWSILGKYISIKKLDPTASDQPPPQQITVTGRVSDEQGNGLQSITVTVKGTSVATQTNIDGLFTIDVPSRTSTLVFSGIGFSNKEVKLSGQTNLGTVRLDISNVNLNEVVITGYSSQRKRDITGAVSVVNTDELTKVPAPNITQQLQGRASGVTVLLNGTPGVPAKVRVRGLGSFSNNNPLYVVDGVQTSDIRGINPADIESMQVLKDAASASIYGVRSSNGVIVITTKKGKKGVSVQYDMTYGLQLPGTKPDENRLTPLEVAEFSWMVLRNENKPLTGSIYGDGPEPRLPDYLFAGQFTSSAGAPGPLYEGNPAVDPSLYNLDPTRVGDPGYTAYIIVPANKQGTKWWDVATRNAPIQSHNLSFASGNDNSRFLFSGSYFEQQAITLFQFYKRYTARLNSEFSLLNKKIRIGENLQFFASEANVQGNSAGGNKSNNQEDSDMAHAAGGLAIVPIYNSGGHWAGSKGDWGGKNPIALLTRKKDNRDNNISLFGNVYGEADIIDGLTFRTSFGGSINTQNTFSFPIVEYENSLNQNVPTYSESFVRTNNWIFTNTLTYRKQFGKHNITGLVGYEATRGGGRQVIGAASQFYTYSYYPYINLGTGSTPNLSGSGPFVPVSTASTFGSVNYAFDDKYLVTALVRRDGSSKFLGKEQYGIFPAFSLGWRISSENFMQNVSWVNDLKLRGSWGKSGNEAALDIVNAFTTFRQSPGSSFYDFDGTNNNPARGFYQNFIGNPAGQWEENVSTNIGFDATILNNSTNIVFDWYQKETNGLLTRQTGNAQLGAGAYNPAFKNIGSMKNWGIDLLISNRANLTSNLTLTTTLTFTTYKNEITKVSDDIDYFDFNSPSSEANRLGGSTITRNMVGYSLNTYYGYEVIGIFQSQAEVDAAPQQLGGGNTNSAFPGSFKYRDISGPDGKPDNVIDAHDRTVIGDPNPDFTYGVNFDLQYKGFDLQLFFYGVGGKQNFMWSKWFDMFPNFGGMSRETLYNSWLPDGSRPNASAPIQLSSASFSTSAAVNSYYVEDASYLRLRNAQIGYTFKSELLSKLKISRARVYLQATNIFTITKYPGLDPEVMTNDDRASGIDLNNFPTVKQVSVGANLNF